MTYQFTTEESVIVDQYYKHRLMLAQVLRELKTHEDAILTILRGHQAQLGVAGNVITRRVIKVVLGEQIETISIESMPCQN